MKLVVKDGTTSLSVDLILRDSASTTADGKTGLAFNTSGLTCYGKLSGAAPAAITLATLAATNSAWSSGGFKENDATNMKGSYRFDIPNAYLTGAKSSQIVFQHSAIVTKEIEIQIIAADLNDAVRLGLSALPNAAAEGAGGLYTRGSGAGQIAQDANGRINTNVKAWSDSAVASTNTAGVPIVDTRAVIRQGTAQAGGAANITLDAGASGTADVYVPCSVRIISGTGSNQGARVGIAYNASTKVLTVVPAWTTQPDNTSIFQLDSAAVSLEAWERAAPTALSSGKVQTDANLITWLGTAPATLVSQLLQVSVATAQAGSVTSSAFAADAIDSNALATSAVNEIRDAVKNLVVESAGSYTLQQVLSIMLALAGGVTTNSGDTYKTPDGSATRITATVDGSSNRTGMVLNPS
jgi:hypothetical protein